MRKSIKIKSFILCFLFLFHLIGTTYAEGLIVDETEGFFESNIVEESVVDESEAIVDDSAENLDNFDEIPNDSLTVDADIDIDSVIESTDYVSELFATNSDQLFVDESVENIKAIFMSENGFKDDDYGVVELLEKSSYFPYFSDAIYANSNILYAILLGVKNTNGDFVYPSYEVKVYLESESFSGDLYALSDEFTLIPIEYTINYDSLGYYVLFDMVKANEYLFVDTVEDNVEKDSDINAMSEIEPISTVDDNNDYGIDILEVLPSYDSNMETEIETETETVEQATEKESKFDSESESESEIEMETELVADIQDETETETNQESEIDVLMETEPETDLVLNADNVTTQVLTAKKENYTVSLEYGESANIPDNAYLSVNEIKIGSDNYDDYMQVARDTLNDVSDKGSVLISDATRFFDIKIMSVDDNNVANEVTITDYVTVTISCDDFDVEDFNINVLHFDDSNNTADVLESSVSNNTTDEVVNTDISFDTNSFSVYGVVEAKDVEPVSDLEKITSIEDLLAKNETGFMIGHVTNCFATNSLLNVDANGRTGIARTAVVDPESAHLGGAGVYHVHAVGNKYYIYYVNGSGEYVGVVQSSNSLRFATPISVSADDTDETINEKFSSAGATAFTIEKFGSNTSGDVWRIRGNNNYCWNRQGNATGKTIAAYNNVNDYNAQMYIWEYPEEATDPLNLNNKVYSLAVVNEDITGYGVLSNSSLDGSSKSRLASKTVNIRPNVLGGGDNLLVAEDTDLVDFTFTSINGNKYYMTTVIDNELKYLSIGAEGVKFCDNPDDTCVISVRSENGMVQLFSNAYFLGHLNTNFFESTNVATSASWFNLVTKMKELEDDDFVIYSAHLVDISDVDRVPDKQHVVMYVTLWNEETLQYEPYVVNYDGSLIKCYEVGDTISWYGNQANSTVWEFTEYHWDDGTPNYYYELENLYSNSYVAPKLSTHQILSDEKIGINMNGRRYGDKSTTIIAWDAERYAYVALGVDEDTREVIPTTLAHAQEIFFAVLDETETDQLTTVPTIDNNDFGIKLRMVDFNNGLVNNRDAEQLAVFGGDHTLDGAGLLQPYLVDGYPVTDSAVTGVAQQSLERLFGSAVLVNHLFLQDVYNEHGYFAFDSTENFAHLESTNNFTVYDQLAAIGNNTRLTRVHGQFMPYNQIRAGSFSTVTNQTDVFANPLSDLNPRKGERLYLIRDNEADYFFGMEMEASFVQTESGLDARGHDIIFEFSGDDDFWLFVDDQLVLDLGGVHSASTGNINFRTGDITLVVKDSDGIPLADRTENTTLYDVVRKNYTKTHPDASASDIQAYLDSIFELNDAGQYVFQDYTQHTMKMYYMERGAGASNLKMKFNLSSMKPNTVLLSKDVSGTTKDDYLQAEFAYQIYYYTREDGETIEHLLTDTDGNNHATVNYYERTTPVRYLPSYTPAGTQSVYNSVFMLAPSEKAEIHFPDGATRYRIVECGVNTNIYDGVEVNGVSITGVPSSLNREDYASDEFVLTETQRVAYDNHVKDSAIRTMSFKKVLYDETGEVILTSEDDPVKFDFRLYLGTEDASTLHVAYMHEYFVKDENLEYCRYDFDTQSFVSTGMTVIPDDISEDLLEEITFVSSPNGAISGIPAGYTVEINNMLVGTQFEVEERDNEIPIGYSRIGYECVNNSYLIRNGHVNEGYVRDNSDPVMLVKNKRGWGLVMEKEWSDVAFTTYHDDVKFGIYLDGELVTDSIQTLSHGDSSLYWYFDSLEPGHTFSEYVVREVVIDGDTVIPKEDGETVFVDAIVKGELVAREFGYEVSYHPGTVTGSDNSIENVRTDVVSNIRNGIKFVKEDMDGNPVQGASFTLKNSLGEDVGASSYVSRLDGLITVAYLDDGEYELSEILPARGYIGLEFPITVTVANGVVSCDSESSVNMYDVDNTGAMPVVTVRNKEYILQIVKQSDNDAPLAGAHFAIYKQIQRTNGTVRKDYYPVAGYEDLVSNAQGVVITGLQDWNPGYYYLVETQAPDGYDLLDEDICFRIKPTGGAEVSENAERFVSITEADNVISYVIHTVNMVKHKDVKFRKVDARMPDSIFLQGAVFDLYRVVDSVMESTPLYSDLVSDENGYLVYDNSDVFSLDFGDYVLVETTPPAGYIMRSVNVPLTVSSSGVTYDDGFLSEAVGKHFDILNNVYTLDISNQPESGWLFVTKEVDGVDGYTDRFDFTLVLEKEGLIDGNWNCQIRRNGRFVNSTIHFDTVDDHLEGTFQLGDGEALLMKVPVGTQYEITEALDADFWTTIGTSLEVNNVASGEIGNMQSEVNFINHLNDIVPTGRETNRFGMLFLLFSVCIFGIYVALCGKLKVK